MPNQDLYQFTCGHTMPSIEKDAYKQTKIDYSHEIEVNLHENDDADIKFSDSVKKGKWTMVYDEGFDILVEGYSFFAFSKYDFNINKALFSSKWVSKCYSTLVGWFHKKNKWGCFYAEKVGENPNKITNGESSNKLLVVENTVKSMDNRIDQHPSLIQHSEEVIDDNEILFLEFKNQLKITSEFKDHSKVIDKINSISKLWKATAYKEFSNMTIEELNKFAGRKKNDNFFSNNFNFKKSIKSKKNKKHYYEFNNYHISHKKTFLKRNEFHDKDSNYDDMPKEHRGWMKYMFEARNQGSCGSCYAVATIGMLESRLNILYEGQFNDRLSVQHILSCSVYNQGCDGGYSYLALKFGNEVELVPESCFPYKRVTGNCNDRCSVDNLNKVYKVKNYRYLGGSYGKCTEYEIMKDVLKNGPVVVSFEPDYLFMHYKSGIYMSQTTTWLTKGDQKPQWTKVDHSVVLVGWGFDEENKTKYWILQNSWGENWGEKGFFKMIRGIDHMGIESICESGIPYIVEKNKNNN